MGKKDTNKILSGIAGVLCVVSVFLPWFMHTNDVHPYTVLEMTQLGDYFRIASSLESMFAALTWIAVIASVASALVMLLLAFGKKRIRPIMSIGIPILAVSALILASILLFEYGFFPVFGPAAVLIATILHLVLVFKGSGKDTTIDKKDTTMQ